MRRLILLFMLICGRGYGLNYTIVDTAQQRCFDDKREIMFPKRGEDFFGQDAQYKGHFPDYVKNADGTVTDRNTGLMWTVKPGKKTYEHILSGAPRCSVGGYDDWRVPSVKELYSLMIYGESEAYPADMSTDTGQLFISAKHFNFGYGGGTLQRMNDCVCATSTFINGSKIMFGVDFSKGYIKGYPVDTKNILENRFYVLYVRGNSEYGKNEFADNNDGTVTDEATGLMWMKVDSGHLGAGMRENGGMNWQQALEWAENLENGGYDDWRLPSAKELASIVDYSRCAGDTNSACLDEIFEISSIVNEAGERDWPYFWTSSTHRSVSGDNNAVYIAFGRGVGWVSRESMGENRVLVDVHGGGSQGSDLKNGDPNDYRFGRGVDGEVVRIYNFVRCVRGGKADYQRVGPPLEPLKIQTVGGGVRDETTVSNFGQLFIRRLDRDGDNRVSFREFDGPLDQFKVLDRNRDGFITGEEANQMGIGERYRR